MVCAVHDSLRPRLFSSDPGPVSCPWRQPGQRVGGTPLGPKSRVWQVHARDRDLQGERSALEHSRLARPSHLHMLTHTCLAHAYRQFLNHQSRRMATGP